jgi:hypothetical protein
MVPPRFTVVITMVAVFAALTVPALATASSGRIYKGTNGGVATCTEAVIRDVADNAGYTTTWDYTSCTTAHALSAGWLGAYASGYRDGAYCANTGWAYSSTLTHSFGVGAHLCSNPAGSQAFNTIAISKKWTGTGYLTYSSTASPSQNY